MCFEIAPLLLLFLTNPFHLGKYHLPGKRQSLRRYQRKNAVLLYVYEHDLSSIDELFPLTNWPVLNA